ncbi:DNA endonuclease RBBP8 [Brachionichthys hirsutus]|uniref:DNA endonuclease RBBP8 n=1 Tax=Brachionichthys hirsutus TaxID=412623 RepID=UPI0036052769
MPSGGTLTPADEAFEGFWRQLRVCHQNALQELEAKVSKLKRDRCLDAQRLELFFNRNQQLKEQNKNLRDAIGLLEERLRAGERDRCAGSGDQPDPTLRLVDKLKAERNSLEDENKKLRTELQNLKMSRLEVDQGSSPEQEEGVIPDSPVLPSSMPVISKLKKCRNIDKMKHVRYAETPRPHANSSLFNAMIKEPVAENPGLAEVLVPNTCELDTSPISDDMDLNVDKVIAETCRLECLDKITETAEGQRSTKSPRKYRFCLNRDSTTESSPSLLPRFKRFADISSVNGVKRKKEESGREEGEPSEPMESEQPEQINQTSAPSNSQSFKDHRDSRVQATQNGTPEGRPGVSCTSPAFKKPNVRRETGGEKKRGKANASQDQRDEGADGKHNAGPAWSVDPSLALSMYDSEWRENEQREERRRGELADTDCTWVSRSLLQAREENTPDSGVAGLGGKANDSLDMMFDTTAYGEYKSCNGSHLGRSQPCEEDDGEEDEDPPENATSPKKHEAQQPTFAHVAVVRKKDERRKLKGTTCKECELYYAHLPEEERQKKLSACSRHRFLYIPPPTPENFWEVGFPSTQTCIDRGYIKEETNPQTRPRRRQPFNALFSPKPKSQQS